MDTTTQANPALFTGRLITPTSPTKEGLVVIAPPDTDYQLHLATDGVPPASAQGRVQGQITAQATKIDIVNTGGRFIEPSIGRPRRIQGRVVAADPAANTLTIKVVVPFICTLQADQKTDQFPIGSLVRCNIERGVRFEPMK